jgi:dTDP-glucose 4,6-dehydratase
MIKILVLGSNSFAGSCLVDYLLKKNFKVFGISRSKENNIKYKKNNKIKNFIFLKADINKDLTKIEKIIDKNKFKLIIDFMGQGMVAESWDNADQWFKTNVYNKIKLIDILSKKKFLKRYIRISTPEVYGSSKYKIKENSNFNPSTPYALTHSTIDQYLKLSFKKNRFPYVVLRFSNFYGETQPMYRIIPKTIISIIKGKKLPLHGGGNSLRSFIYIDDFCSAIYKSISKSKIGEIYNVSSNEIITIKNLIKKICLKMNKKFSEVIYIEKDRPGKDQKYFMDNTKVKKYLNWKNKINLDKGLDKVISWQILNKKKLIYLKTYYTHKQ